MYSLHTATKMIMWGEIGADKSWSANFQLRFPWGTGRYTINSVVHGVSYALEFYLVYIEVQPTMGIHTHGLWPWPCKTSQAYYGREFWNVLRPANFAGILSEYPNVFQGIGRFPGTYKITFKNDAVLSITTPQKIPLALKVRVEKVLETIERNEIKV